MTKVKLEETKGQRRLHIGSYFTDLNETDYQELVRIFSEKSRQAAVSGSLPLPELIKELGECLEQSSVLIDLGAARAQDDDRVPAHLQRVKEARQLYKFYKESGGNDR